MIIVNKTNENEKLLCTVKEASMLLGVNVHFVYRLISSGMLPALKLGNLKIRRATLEDFILKYEGMDLSNLDQIVELKTD